MTVPMTPFLRKALFTDATISGAAALLMLAGAPLLAPLLDLPEALLFWAGFVLVPFVALLVVVARRQSPRHWALRSPKPNRTGCWSPCRSGPGT